MCHVNETKVNTSTELCFPEKKKHFMSSTQFSGKMWNFLWLQVSLMSSVLNVSYGVTVLGDDKDSYVDDLFQTGITDGFPEYPVYQPEIEEELNLIYSNITNLNKGIFPWDKKIPAHQFQAVYCAKMCHGPDLIMADVCQDIECYPCGCDKPLCHEYGSCCPDYADVFPANFSSPAIYGDSSLTTTQDSPDLNSSVTERIDHTLEEGFGQHVECDTNLYIRSCPANYIGIHVKTKCEMDVQEGEQDLGTFLRVTDNLTGLTYFNKYCAMCNAVNDFVYWKLKVSCSNYMNVYRAISTDELLRLGNELHSSCQVVQIEPDGVSLTYCSEYWFDAPVVGVCNVTGKWDIYDEDVERACSKTSGLVNRVRLVKSWSEMYKNVFCALCNMKTPQTKEASCDLIGRGFPEKLPILPFSMLLNFGSENSLGETKRSFDMCSHDTEWTTPDNLCLPWQCSPGKILKNGNCSTAIAQIRGLVYQIQVVYVLMAPEKNHQKTETAELEDSHRCELPLTYLRQFQGQIEAILSNITLEIKVKTSIFFNRPRPLHGEIELPFVQTVANVTPPDSCLCRSQVNRFTLDGFLLAKSSIIRDEIEQLLVDELITKSVNFNISHMKSLELKALLDPYRQNLFPDCTSVQIENQSCAQEDMTKRYRKSDAYTLNTYTRIAIFLEPLLSCPFVSFNYTKFKYKSGSSTSPDNISVVLYITEQPIVISKSNELNLLSITEDGTLRVCRELLEEKIASFSYNFEENSWTLISQYILTLVCVSASILCLAATLITYSLFPVLRSVAGKNNMFLCGSLLLAQSSLLATSHVQPNSQLCTFFAISTHFLWLSMFCWCFTSCLHMFLTFSSKTRSVQTTSSERKYIIKRLVACSVVPALVVITVIVVNYFTSQGRVIGYGQTTCFLDSPTLVGTALVTPLCLVLICNVYFFSATIYKINNIRKLQSGNFKKEDKNNLYIYVKLSSVTGLFWIVSIISEATNNDPLRFIAISLNGLQGVFIFLSYICNKRVSRLFLRGLGLEKTATTSTSEKSTIL